MYSQTSATHKEPKHVIGITGNHKEVRPVPYKDHDDPSECVSITDLNRAWTVFLSYMYFIVKQTCIWFLFYSLFPLSFSNAVRTVESESCPGLEVSNSTRSKNRSFCVLSLEQWNLRRPACLSNLTVRSILPFCKCPYRQQKNKRIEELIKLSILELQWVFCVWFCLGFCLSGYIQSAWRHQWSFSGQWVFHKCVSSKKALEAI